MWLTVFAFGFVFVAVVLILRSMRDERITLPPGTASRAPASSIESLVAAGRKIEAIKLLRRETGLGLKEAKERVDEMSRQLRAR